MINDQLDNLYARIRAEEREARESRVREAYALEPRLKALDENRTARCRARRACAAWTVPRLIHRVIPGLCAQPFESNRY